MPLYIISYDLRKQRNYAALYDLLNEWEAVTLLESVWLAELKGPCDIIRARVDQDDGVAVIELQPGMDWATWAAKTAGTDWLKKHSP
eukprot:Cvel_14148.t1-p1 / transcript=Cvel_14148.t1 / gene=Cvel_14148 / organism=Chromera_velia_CCMP2878 / gene_product=hypothetical protein / transcript_product=hypothetical protein / location=Cvel_scaffold997:3705-3962(+) / protein_length=86 / sequence_SO=supercontig / SO=protein_coding / is_pseudo=false